MKYKKHNVTFLQSFKGPRAVMRDMKLRIPRRNQATPYLHRNVECYKTVTVTMSRRTSFLLGFRLSATLFQFHSTRRDFKQSESSRANELSKHSIHRRVTLQDCRYLQELRKKCLHKHQSDSKFMDIGNAGKSATERYARRIRPALKLKETRKYTAVFKQAIDSLS